jgi:hypothetical protein
MPTLRRRIHLGLGWLTALLTLVTGIPHFNCHCDNVRVKPFCLDWFVPAVCCREAPKEPAEPEADRPVCCSCCHPDPRDPASDPPEGAGIGSRGCQKEWAGAEAAILPPAETGKAGLNPGLCWTVPASSSVSFSPEAGPSRLSEWSHAPPPTNLVVVLQHYLV